MKSQALFSSKDKSKKIKCRLLQFLFGALRVNTVIRFIYSRFFLLMLTTNIKLYTLLFLTTNISSVELMFVVNEKARLYINIIYLLFA